jgi:hypothetical protein
MNPENPEPEPEPTEETQAPAPNPIDELTLPHTEPHAISQTNPHKKLFTILGILVLLAGMATGYVLFRHK